MNAMGEGTSVQKDPSDKCQMKFIIREPQISHQKLVKIFEEKKKRKRRNVIYSCLSLSVPGNVTVDNNYLQQYNYYTCKPDRVRFFFPKQGGVYTSCDTCL